jgi:hypothetical protein
MMARTPPHTAATTTPTRSESTESAAITPENTENYCHGKYKLAHVSSAFSVVADVK